MGFFRKDEEEAPPASISAGLKPSNNEDSAKGAVKSKSKEWGYDLYPERRGEKYKPKWSKILLGMEGRENIDKIKCERNVYWCVKNSPLVKLMMGALRSSGCPIDLRRHISCEVCDTSVTGGYDPVLNQIVVCQNMARKEGMVQGVLTHEMIHMFDYCNNDLDFRNIDHLACTEIRAANLAHCSFLSAMTQGDASIFNIKESHQNCVKTKALHSVLAVRHVSRQEAIDAVERVFPKCYADLEPIGRRIRRNSPDQHKAYREAPIILLLATLSDLTIYNNHQMEDCEFIGIIFSFIGDMLFPSGGSGDEPDSEEVETVDTGTSSP